MIHHQLHSAVQSAVQSLFKAEIHELSIQKTRKEFKGDLTLVVFPLLKVSKMNPEQTSNEIGKFLLEHSILVSNYNTVKGFLNLTIHDELWLSEFDNAFNSPHFGIQNEQPNSPIHVVEFSSPNTNKPLHLGHIRNILLGHSVARILAASGKRVKKVQIINDRGIHICKSMLAWQEFGANETPQSTGIKGDHLVGKYYVVFDQQYKKEQQELVAQGRSKEQAEKEAPIFKRAQELLINWEAKDKDVIKLWQMMNAWVYDGFEQTYQRMGVSFDKNYYESDTYLLGKEVIAIGLEKGIFYKKKDGSVWIDLTDDGLDEKILLRADGTAVYMTQDIGTAIQRHDDFEFSYMVYTVGNEQDYHFKVLFLILEKLGYQWATNCYHLSYGMVDLPSGKMKSREGTVVDADELMQEMVQTAKDISQELGKNDAISEEESEQLYETIGLGALNYFMLKVDPKKRMVFNPQESIDFNGNTGPFIQYTYARIQTILSKYSQDIVLDKDRLTLESKEKEIIKQVLEFPSTIKESAQAYNPAIVANYIYNLVKEFNGFYQNVPILIDEDEHRKAFRIALCQVVGKVIDSGMKLLGISVPQRM